LVLDIIESNLILGRRAPAPGALLVPFEHVFTASNGINFGLAIRHVLLNTIRDGGGR
jgi:hypothetical protein